MNQNGNDKKKGGDIMKNGFAAKKVTFCGQQGYDVSQYIDGEEVVKQFIPESSYKSFCDVTGITPVIED